MNHGCRRSGIRLTGVSVGHGGNRVKINNRKWLAKVRQVDDEIHKVIVTGGERAGSKNPYCQVFRSLSTKSLPFFWILIVWLISRKLVSSCEELFLHCGNVDDIFQQNTLN